ncbi:MAG: hypothetical protein ABSH21_08000 [Verrucomicrobiia bacterium]|jgi:hypothetical protein
MVDSLSPRGFLTAALRGPSYTTGREKQPSGARPVRLPHEFAGPQQLGVGLAQGERLQEGEQLIDVRLVINSLEGEQFLVGDLLPDAGNILLVVVQCDEETLRVREMLPQRTRPASTPV